MVSHNLTPYSFSKEMGQALEGLGYESLTEVQEWVIPAALAGQDIIVQAQTGSGKTAAFAIPVCEKIVVEQRYPQALVLTPTRELALQVKQEIAGIGRYKAIRCAVVMGKQSMEVQQKELRQRVHVVVGTPGRCLDHIEKGNINLTQIKYFIIDEADKMLDLGFVDQVEAILLLLPRNRVTMVFSATIPESIQAICAKHMQTPLRIEVKSTNPTSKLIQQSFYEVPEAEKLELIKQIIYTKNPGRCIMFCNTREKVETLFGKLKREWRSCEILHGGMEQKDRLTTMWDFKRGEFRFLIATDVASRGIHIDDVTLVINIDLPPDNESYVHRIGRTGRAGTTGTAISLITPDERNCLAQLEEYLHYKIPLQKPPDREQVEMATLVFNQTKVASVFKPDNSGRINRDIARIRINAGKTDRMRPGDILGAITAITGVTAADTGIIDIQGTCSYVEIFAGKGELVSEALSQAKIKGKIRSIRNVGFQSGPGHQ